MIGGASDRANALVATEREGELMMVSAPTDQSDARVPSASDMFVGMDIGSAAT